MEILVVSLLIAFIVQQFVIFRLNKSNRSLKNTLNEYMSVIGKLMDDGNIRDSKYKEIIMGLSKSIHKHRPPK